MNFEAALSANQLENPFEQHPYKKAEVHVEPSKFEGLSELNRSQFAIFGAKADEIYESYQAIIHWLKLPYVHDNFGEDHLARRAWFKTLNKEEYSEMLKNKFRNNPAGVLAMHIKQLKIFLKKSRFLPLDSERLFPDNSQNFAKLKQSHVAEERRAVMENFEAQCQAIIEYLNSCVSRQKLAA